MSHKVQHVNWVVLTNRALSFLVPFILVFLTEYTVDCALTGKAHWVSRPTSRSGSQSSAIDICALSYICLAAPALAAENENSDFSHYSLSTSVNPFGGSLNFGVNTSEKTTWLFSFGGFSDEAPLKPKIDDVEYTIDNGATWVGFFVNHRPVASASWFRVIAGLGIGSITNDVSDADGNTYTANYKENPVGYLGIGFGAEAKKGFMWGVDLGILQTAGPMIMKSSASEKLADDYMFGTILPNIQFSLGWGF